MNCVRVGPTCFVLILLSASGARGQAPQGQQPPASTVTDKTDCLDGLVKALKSKLAIANKADALAGARREIQQWPVYVCEFTTDSVKSRLLTIAEQKRQDKQPGATSNSSGSTSLVSKGSSPWLLGFALEHGGVT